MSLALKQSAPAPAPFPTLIQEEKRQFTYADYLKWPEDVRVEIIYGIAHLMAPPLTRHQEISMELSRILAQFLKGKTCKVFAAPFGVRLFPKKDHSDNTVVEPDIVVICDSSKIDERGCNGAPDLVIEILSPSTRKKDKTLKFELYLKAKVREYWVVSPENKEIEVHLLESDSTACYYSTKLYGINDPDDEDKTIIPEIVPVSVLPGLEINTRDIFQE